MSPSGLPPPAVKSSPTAEGTLDVTMDYRGGTLELRAQGALPPEAPACVWDPRTQCARAPAYKYAELLRYFRRVAARVTDHARRYTVLETGLVVHREPRPFQTEALEAWRRAQGRGVVVLPTGAGKTHVALLAMDVARRSTLVVAPTLELVRQWFDLLRQSFRVPIGVMAGGEHRIEDVTVTTYDSAYMHMEHLGSRFGMLVFDECHHLPSQSYALAAKFAIAPYRLGLSATPERTDERHVDLEDLVGPTVYRRDIPELAGDYLADYDVVHVAVSLTADERRVYEDERRIYLEFLRTQGIRMQDPRGWADFILQSSRTERGRRAMQAYRKQRGLAFAAPAKLDYLELLLHEHATDRAIVFTEDNATAYDIARRSLVPVITHQTRVTERSEILRGLMEGTYRAVVTSKVLNEGVDVPCANVAFVVSGSGSVREHVQRLGRILRKLEGKRARLYELVTEDTAEAATSARRREHSAYRPEGP